MRTIIANIGLILIPLTWPIALVFFLLSYIAKALDAYYGFVQFNWSHGTKYQIEKIVEQVKTAKLTKTSQKDRITLAGKGSDAAN